MGALHCARLLPLRRLHENVTPLASWRRWSSTTHTPLRILFCGADQFSIYSLKALNEIRLQNPEKVASIDVVCKPDKRVGRGLKQIQEVPIKRVALEDLKLPIHQIDTFTGWTPPDSINLVVAVSFGLLVPPRILNSAKYGGLNVHPSMLPDLRGPAPLHHALLNRDEKTGVTLQTLHHKHFDQGRIIDQTPQPGLDIPHEATVESLLGFVGPLGAEMLHRNILTGNFLDPESKVGSQTIEPRHAGKITPEDRRIKSHWDAHDFEVRDRVLGRTWTTVFFKDEGAIRVTFEGWKDTTKEFRASLSMNENVAHSRFGDEFPTSSGKDEESNMFYQGMAFNKDPTKQVFFRAADASGRPSFVSPKYITIGSKPKKEVSWLRQMILGKGSETRYCQSKSEV